MTVNSVYLLSIIYYWKQSGFSYLAHKQLFLQKGNPTNLDNLYKYAFSKNKNLI